VCESLEPVFTRHPEYQAARILERMVEPERTIIFRVPWMDDQGVFISTGEFRVQMNSGNRSYKGGLRFHPSVTLSILKVPSVRASIKKKSHHPAMGGGKGGSDFDPKGKNRQWR